MLLTDLSILSVINTFPLLYKGKRVNNVHQAICASNDKKQVYVKRDIVHFLIYKYRPSFLEYWKHVQTVSGFGSSPFYRKFKRETERFGLRNRLVLLLWRIHRIRQTGEKSQVWCRQYKKLITTGLEHWITGVTLTRGWCCHIISGIRGGIQMRKSNSHTNISSLCWLLD